VNGKVLSWSNEHCNPEGVLILYKLEIQGSTSISYKSILASRQNSLTNANSSVDSSGGKVKRQTISRHTRARVPRCVLRGMIGHLGCMARMTDGRLQKNLQFQRGVEILTW